MITDKSFIIIEQKEFEEEKNKLILLINKFENVPIEVLNQSIHPIFGKLKKEEWSTLQCKHIDHHLRQFGV